MNKNEEMVDSIKEYGTDGIAWFCYPDDVLKALTTKDQEIKELINKYQIMVGEHKYHCECKAGDDYLNKFLEVLREDLKAISK